MAGRRLLLVLAAAAAVAGPAAAQEAGPRVEVSDAAGLRAALDRLEDGGTIALAPGDYGDLRIEGRSTTAPTRIVSADAARPAVFSSVHVEDSRNLAFADFTVRHALEPGGPSHSDAITGFLLRNVQYAEVRGLTLTGSVDGDLTNDGIGAAVRDSATIVFAGNRCHDLMRCAVFHTVQGLVVRENTARFIRSDGLNFAAVSDVLIENNDLAAFPIQHGDPRKGGDHKDFIQFWTNGTTGSNRNVVIRGNTLIEVGTRTQGIFIRSETGVLNENFLIEDNIIYSSSYHGLTVGGVRNAVVRNNTVIGKPDRTVAGLNVLDSVTVQLADNLTPRLTVKDSVRVLEDGTQLIHWRAGGGHEAVPYGEVFANAFAVRDVSDLRPLPGGLATETGAHRRFAALDLGDVGIREESSAAAPLRRTLRADCETCGEDAAFRWSLGDGTEKVGRAVDHTYDRPGRYVVTLQREGAPPVRRTVEAMTPLRLALPFDGDTADASGLGNTARWEGEPAYADGRDGQAARFGAGGAETAVVVEPGAAFSGLDALTLAFDVKLEDSGDARLVWLHQAFGIELVRGGLVVHLFGADGHRARLVAPGALRPEAEWHRVVLTFDGSRGTAVLSVDGREVAQAAGLDSRLASVENRALTIGGIHGRFLNGRIDSLRLADRVLPAAELEALAGK